MVCSFSVVGITMCYDPLKGAQSLSSAAECDLNVFKCETDVMLYLHQYLLGTLHLYTLDRITQNWGRHLHHIICTLNPVLCTLHGGI